MFKYTMPFLIAFTLFVTACGSQVDYIGDTYAPTTDVDIYFSTSDVTEEYRKMGRATIKGDNSEKLQEQLVKKAKESGADGISKVKTTDQSTLKVTAIFIKYHKNL